LHQRLHQRRKARATQPSRRSGCGFARTIAG
jgi:hypothetical protein